MFETVATIAEGGLGGAHVDNSSPTETSVQVKAAPGNRTGTGEINLLFDIGIPG